MSKLSGYTFTGTPNDQIKYVNTKVVSSGATALVVSLEDTDVTISAGEINVSAFKNAAGTPKDAIVNANDILYNIISNADATASALPVAGNSVGVADIALPVADANVLAALGASDYTDDSAEFTPATSKGVAIMGVQTSDAVDAGDVGAIGMTLARGMYTDTSSVAGTATNVNGGNRDAGTQTVTLADDDPAVTGLSDKTQMSQITDGTNEADVIIQDSAFGTAAKGLPLFGKYQTAPTTYDDNDSAPILLDANGRIVLSSDIELGSVELKDGDTDNRANIKEANTVRTVSTFVLATQEVGADGTVSPTGSLNTNAPFSKLTDGTNEGIIKDASTFATTDVALGVADANVLTALSAVAIPTTIVGGTKDVTTAGTREALGASTTIKSVTIRAKAANGGNIYVGGVTVDSANGIALAANDSVELDIANLATVYVDSSIDGEGVGFTYFN